MIFIYKAYLIKIWQLLIAMWSIKNYFRLILLLIYGNMANQKIYLANIILLIL